MQLAGVDRHLNELILGLRKLRAQLSVLGGEFENEHSVSRGRE